MVSALLLVPAFALQIYMLFYYRSSYLFDNAFVTGGASALAMDGQVAKEAVYYLSVYPNQNAYAVLTAVLWKLGTAAGISRAAMPLLLNCVNLVFLDTAAVLFLLTVSAYKNGPRQLCADSVSIALQSVFVYRCFLLLHHHIVDAFCHGNFIFVCPFSAKKGKTSLCDIGHIGTGGWLRVSAARNDNDPIYCCDRLSVGFWGGCRNGIFWQRQLLF